MTELITTPAELREHLAGVRSQGKTIGLVPTMGALHEGHLSLADASRAECDFTVATIFVNPLQFGPGEDFTRYPRMLDADTALLAGRGVDLVFAPSNEDVYRPGHSTYVDVSGIAEPLEGQFRPGHFRGVATVVLKLFNMAPANVAYFGQKDYQQTLVIRRLRADLDLPIAIRVCPIVREPDGLALSSRNAYLSPEQRGQALALSRGLSLAGQLLAAGVREAQIIRSAIMNTLSEAGIDRVDYVALVDPDTLKDVAEIRRPALAVIAAHVGKTRLIDNALLG